MTDQQKLLTKYLIFETDEVASVFTRVGEQLAGGSEEAIRKFYANPPTDRAGFVVAVSENSFKLRNAKATVKTSIAEVPMPALTVPQVAETGEPVQEPLVS
jgi:hypothetical protein